MAVDTPMYHFKFFLSNEKTIGIDWYWDNIIYTLHWYHWYIDIYMNTSFHLINQHTEKKNHMMKKKFSKNGWSKSHDLDNMHQSWITIKKTYVYHSNIITSGRKKYIWLRFYLICFLEESVDFMLAVCMWV